MLGERIRLRRRRRGLTQGELAELLGISTEAYGRLERGLSLPSLPTMVLLGKQLNLSIDRLLDDSVSEKGFSYDLLVDDLPAIADGASPVAFDDVGSRGVNFRRMWAEMGQLDESTLEIVAVMIHSLWLSSRRK